MQSYRDHVSVSRNTLTLPSALERADDIVRRIQQKQLVVCLDYDGTLTPIVDRPEQALLSTSMRQTLTELAGRWPLMIISGRDRADVQRLVQLDDIFYAGSHGFDITGPHGQQMSCEREEEFLSSFDFVEQELMRRLARVEGVLVERKKFSIAVHVRGVAREDAKKVEVIVDDILGRHPDLRKGFGKQVFELQPRLDWHKGKAVLWLLQVLHLDESAALPIFIGDDRTDEDAFKTLSDRGIGIVVEAGSRPTAATYVLKQPAEVQSFLRRLISCLPG
jgi:trehalose 6-phosphate phosphatase